MRRAVLGLALTQLGAHQLTDSTSINCWTTNRTLSRITSA